MPAKNAVPKGNKSDEERSKTGKVAEKETKGHHYQRNLSGKRLGITP